MACRSPLPVLVLALAGSSVAASDAPDSGRAPELRTIARTDPTGAIKVLAADSRPPHQH